MWPIPSTLPITAEAPTPPYETNTQPCPCLATASTPVPQDATPHLQKGREGPRRVSTLGCVPVCVVAFPTTDFGDNTGSARGTPLLHLGALPSSLPSLHTCFLSPIYVSSTLRDTGQMGTPGKACLLPL